MYALEERNLDDDNFIKLVRVIIIIYPGQIEFFFFLFVGDVMLQCFRICIWFKLEWMLSSSLSKCIIKERRELAISAEFQLSIGTPHWLQTYRQVGTCLPKARFQTIHLLKNYWQLSIHRITPVKANLVKEFKTFCNLAWF